MPRAPRPRSSVAPPAVHLRNWPFMSSKVLLLLPLVWATTALPQSNNLPSKESLTFNIEWRLISAGKAKIDWTPSASSRTPSQIHVHLESIGLVSKLFKVEDEYNALYNPALCVQNLQMTAHEGSRQRETRSPSTPTPGKPPTSSVTASRTPILLSQELDTPPCVHDVRADSFSAHLESRARSKRGHPCQRR